MAVDLDAGELRHRVILQTVTQTSDDEGGYTDVWDDVGTYWALVKPMRAKQQHEYRTINVEATHLVKIRGGVDIEETQRILFNSRVFEVLTVENQNEESVAKWVICKERRA